MPKRTRARRQRQTDSTEAPPTVGVIFKRFWVAQALMREIPEEPRPEDEPAAYPITLDMSIAIKVAREEPVAFAGLTVDVKGDPRSKPYEVRVEIVGEFRAIPGQSPDLGEFCREVAPTILFPYVREIVDRLTRDGRYGTIRLDPLNVRAVLAHGTWKPMPVSPTPSVES